MKLKVFRLLLVMVLLCAGQAFGDPLLVVVLMVKNEAAVITDTLQPFVDGGVHDFVIFDTGSTDGTQEIAREFFREHNLPSTHIVEEPFVDFSTSRNRALAVTEELFPQATFMLMPDAEWYMHNAEALVRFCECHKNDFFDSYFVSIRNTTMAFYVSRLIRCRTGIHFVGAVHEVLNKLTIVNVPDECYFEWRPSRKGQVKSAQRWQRDRDLLLKSYEQNPCDARTLFYLAQTYECLGDWENAYIFYEKRAVIRGWDEENFMTQFRLGNVAEHLRDAHDSATLDRATHDGASSYPLAIRHYLEAFSLRPHRAEPLIKIADYYLKRDEMALAFLFAERAAKIPYPVKDRLFVEKYMYDFVRYDILGRCAWYVGEYEIGEWAVRQALKVKPESAYLKRNLKSYTSRKA
jgi:glycosyltransferase involved in cell wall biosynthesis